MQNQKVLSSVSNIKKGIFGENILLVTSPGNVNRGVAQNIKSLLHPKKITIWANVKPNPEVDDIQDAINKLKKNKFDCIIGLGGGSVIDVAKVLAALLSVENNENLAEYLTKKNNFNILKKITLCAIPTTAGTGSEATPYATIWDLHLKKKYSLSSVKLIPELVVLDPELTLTLNIEQTLFPGLDALSHSLESLWNKNKTSDSEYYAYKALKLANESLGDILSGKNSIENRNKMLVASNYAGKAIAITKTALAHSISYPLTSTYKIPHGLACGFTLETLIADYLCYAQGKKECLLLLRTSANLKNYNLEKYILQHLSIEKIMELIPLMSMSERAGNYIIDSPNIKSILQRSLRIEN